MLADYFEKRLSELNKLFQEKRDQYGGDDELDNFVKGGQLLYGNNSVPAMYKSLLAYMAKHIAYIYKDERIENKNACDKMIESLGDITVYCIIAQYILSERSFDYGNEEAREEKAKNKNKR